MAQHEQLRWFDVSCSPGAGHRWSDVDGAVGYAGALTDDEVETPGVALGDRAGPPIDALVHSIDSFPPCTSRFAAG